VRVDHEFLAGVQLVHPLAQRVGAALCPVGSGVGRATVVVGCVGPCFGSLPALPFLICSSLSRVRPFVRPVEQAGQASNFGWLCGRLYGRTSRHKGSAKPVS
jgi:hypothetical protein